MPAKMQSCATVAAPDLNDAYRGWGVTPIPPDGTPNGLEPKYPRRAFFGICLRRSAFIFSGT